MSIASLDTNVVLRLVVADLPDQHERAKRLVAESGMRFEVSSHVFVEIAFALERHYGLSRGEISEVIMTVLSIETLECDQELLAATVEFWRLHPKLSFEDCLLAEYARGRKAVPLWTFDRKLALQHPAAREVPA